MKKVLIISYFYPPCNLTAANRVGYWSQNFFNHGIYPIIISRRWDNHIGSFDDISKPTIDKELVFKDSNKTIYYIPKKPTLRDKVLNFNKNRFSLFRKLLTFIEIILNSLHIKLSLNYEFYKKAISIIELDKSIKTVIISAMPFNDFFIGYKLKKKFPNINWIADYRDEWTSLNENITFKEKLLNKYDKFFEKKWVSTARCFSYVDSTYIGKIKKSSNNANGIVIRNGFLNYEKTKKKLKKNFLIFTFSGTLYENQNIENFASVIEDFSCENPSVSIEINFLGSLINHEEKIAKKIYKAFTKNNIKLNITERLSKDEMFKYYKKTNFLLMFPFEDKKGIVPTKVLNYLPMETPILFYPTDYGAIDNLINNIGFGYALSQKQQLYNILENEVLNKNKTFLKDYSAKVSQFSAEKQLVKFSEAIKEMSS
jgi:hypothetical protein